MFNTNLVKRNATTVVMYSDIRNIENAEIYFVFIFCDKCVEPTHNSIRGTKKLRCICQCSSFTPATAGITHERYCWFFFCQHMAH